MGRVAPSFQQGAILIPDAIVSCEIDREGTTGNGRTQGTDELFLVRWRLTKTSQTTVGGFGYKPSRTNFEGKEMCFPLLGFVDVGHQFGIA